MKCSNCGSSSLTVLSFVDSSDSKVVTSDAHIMDDVTAQRTLCGRCACIEVHYTPEDRLKRYFKYDYDISDDVQDNLIVRNSKAVGKHGHIVQSLFSGLGDVARDGSFLEIACGRGKLTRLFSESHPGWRCYGIDPSMRAPGEELEKSEKFKEGGATFIKGYFEEKFFPGMTFDIIIAHGFLNRSPVLPELLKIRNLSRKGTFLSIEVCVLEDSVFAPYIWDHPFMYKMDVFESYLEHMGYSLISKTECVSSHHFMFKCVRDPEPPQDICIEGYQVRETERLFDYDMEWWQEVVDKYNSITSNIPEGRRYALFGAGLFSAVLLSLLKKDATDFIIDEVKSGTDFFGFPVVGLKEASEFSDSHVLLCIRPAYVECVAAKLSNYSIPYTDLSP